MELGRKDVISLFIGELHVPLDIARLTIDYDGYDDGRPRDIPDPAKPLHPEKAPDFDDLDALRSPSPPVVSPDPWELARINPVRLPEPPAAPLADNPHPPASPPPSPIPPHGGGGGGALGIVAHRQLRIDASYQSGGDQMDLRAVQANILADDDVVGPEDPGAWPTHVTPGIQSIEALAAGQMPDAYVHANLRSPDDIAHTLESLARASSGPSATLLEGITVDGRHVPAGSPLPADPTLAIPPLPADTHANMAVVQTGGNVATNFGGLANEHGVLGTLVVLGDSYKSDAIVQTNILVDQSAITGTAANAVIQAGGNAANNVAEFVHTLDQNPYAMGFFGGLHWHVDTLQGNFYDINLVTQLNVMSDRDWVQQTATDHYKFLQTGANAQGNLLSEYNIDATHYDLVIVGGNYYSANWIFQTNVLLNSDYVSVAAGPGGAGQETVSTGANWLQNSATIIDYTGASHAITPEMQAVVAALEGRQGTLELSAGLAVPGNGSLELNVLFINGNYYDLNVLQQTNIVNDSDKVVQTLANGESGYVATGGNALSNTAVLADVGPLGGQYVAGQQYSEAVLVQTNIIVESADLPSGQPAVVTNDPAKLASEAAVIVQHDPAPQPAATDQGVAPTTTDHTVLASSDPLSSILS